MVILLIVHIIFALTCLPLILSASILKYLGSNKSSLFAKYSSYSMIGILATGTVLVLAFNANLVSSCYAGLAYTSLFAASYVLYLKLNIVRTK